MKQKRMTLILGLITSVLFLSGCGYNAIPELSEDEERMVVTYMADLLLTHDVNYQATVLNEQQKEQARALEERQKEELKKQLEEEEKRKEQQAIDRENRELETHEAEIVYNASDITTCAKVPEGIKLEFVNYGEFDSYPDGGGELFSFSPVTPTKAGNKLVVVRMQIANESSNTIEYNSMDIGARFRIIVNGEKYSCLNHLYGDLNLYIDDIEPNNSVEALLISEVPQDIEVSDVGLYIINSDKETFNIDL